MNGLKAVTVSEDCHDMRPIIGKCMTHFVTRCMLTLAVSLTSIDTPAEEQANPDKGNVASTTVANSEANAFFETKIRPLLAEHCYECHGEDEQESGLRVDSLSGLLRGGEGYGAAIVPGNPDGSILISAVKHQELTMPPEKKLSTRQIGDLIQWVKMGAPWPGSAEEHQVAESHRSMEITEDDRAWWSYQPVLLPEIPSVDPSLETGNPIDAFIRAKLMENGLSPSGMASKRELIRYTPENSWGKN